MASKFFFQPGRNSDMKNAASSTQVICLISNGTIGLLLNPTIDLGVLNYSKLYENGGLVVGPATVPYSFNGSFVEIDERLAEGRRYDNTQTSLQD